MRLLLNIGLAVDATPAIATHVARQILIANDFILHGDGKVFESDTEPTLVIEVSPDPCGQMDFRQVAVDLRQDCIAVYAPVTNRGMLAGPKAAEWGAFDPTKFLKLDGTRLA